MTGTSGHGSTAATTGRWRLSSVSASGRSARSSTVPALKNGKTHVSFVRTSPRPFAPRGAEERPSAHAKQRTLRIRCLGAILETGSFYPPPAALRLFPLLGFPAHALHPQGVCSIRKAAQPLTAALPYRRGESTALLTVSRHADKTHVSLVRTSPRPFAPRGAGEWPPSFLFFTFL